MKKLLLILLCLPMIFSSCKKEEGCTDPTAKNYNTNAEDNDGSCIYYTKAIVTVRNSNNDVVLNASVTLFPEQVISPQGTLPDASLTKTNYTDANGGAQFTYELEAVLNIEVSKVQGNDTLAGINIIRLEKGETTTKVVEIN